MKRDVKISLANALYDELDLDFFDEDGCIDDDRLDALLDLVHHAVRVEPSRGPIREKDEY